MSKVRFKGGPYDGFEYDLKTEDEGAIIPNSLTLTQDDGTEPHNYSTNGEVEDEFTVYELDD